MARLALAVGYVSRTTSRSEQPELLYLGPSFQDAKDAACNPPPHLGFARAYRIEGLPKSYTVPGFVPPAPAAAAPELDLLPDPPKPAAKKAAAKDAGDD